ncbi:phosphoribosylanthranilate isomerase [Desulfonema magnum]|uniref:N-(5'-phosphoribosyl)anthranilate isomerase n=1 Tax=Desulfonema magnum TaxID=45655 RepID=A0A975BMK6_9BACT|nr:hypothetical protein [Desulfonema magnum]QTA88312.1 N-(5'phosphoribosyl)anthranilate isomerase [Desulfonema magnum]
MRTYDCRDTLKLMKNIIVQIYEVQTPSEAESLIEIGVDRIGSIILSEKEWKVPLIKETVSMTAQTPVMSNLIPLFSNPDSIFRVLDYYRPDVIHFCEALTNHSGSSESREGFCPAPELEALIRLQEDVKKRFPEVRIMRSVPIGEPGMANLVPSMEIARMFEPVSDYFLTDTLLAKVPSPSQASASEQQGSSPESQSVDGFVGITGKTCDWDIAAQLVESSCIPVILAGGISPDNVSDGIRHVRPAGVDSCTGTNALDAEGHPIRFKKDLEKVKQLVEKVRNLKLET